MTLEIYAQTWLRVPGLSPLPLPFPENLSNKRDRHKKYSNARTPLAKQKMLSARNIHCLLPVGDFLTFIYFSTFSF